VSNKKSWAEQHAPGRARECPTPTSTELMDGPPDAITGSVYCGLPAADPGPYNYSFDYSIPLITWADPLATYYKDNFSGAYPWYSITATLIAGSPATFSLQIECHLTATSWGKFTYLDHAWPWLHHSSWDITTWDATAGDQQSYCHLKAAW